MSFRIIRNQPDPLADCPDPGDISLATIEGILRDPGPLSDQLWDRFSRRYKAIRQELQDPFQLQDKLQTVTHAVGTTPGALRVQTRQGSPRLRDGI